VIVALSASFGARRTVALSLICSSKSSKGYKEAERKAKSISKTAAPVPTVITLAFDSQNSFAEQLDLEFSTITDATDPSVTITESLARLFQHTSKSPSDYNEITQMHNMSGTAKDTANSGIGEGATASIGSEGAAANANTTTPLFSLPGTDLRIDWGDACRLGSLPYWSCIKAPSTLCPFLPKLVCLHLRF